MYQTTHDIDNSSWPWHREQHASRADAAIDVNMQMTGSAISLLFANHHHHHHHAREQLAPRVLSPSFIPSSPLSGHTRTQYIQHNLTVAHATPAAAVGADGPLRGKEGGQSKRARVVSAYQCRERHKREGEAQGRSVLALSLSPFLPLAVFSFFFVLPFCVAQLFDFLRAVGRCVCVCNLSSCRETVSECASISSSPSSSSVRTPSALLAHPFPPSSVFHCALPQSYDSRQNLGIRSLLSLSATHHAQKRPLSELKFTPCSGQSRDS